MDRQTGSILRIIKLSARSHRGIKKKTNCEKMNILARIDEKIDYDFAKEKFKQR